MRPQTRSLSQKLQHDKTTLQSFIKHCNGKKILKETMQLLKQVKEDILSLKYKLPAAEGTIRREHKQQQNP